LSLLGLKVAAARGVGALSRRAGRGGTSLPGRLLLRMEPHAIAELARRLERGNAVISATNGKTTTAAMVAAILGRGGVRLVHNRAGANMAGGVATALMTGDGDLGLFEVDEFWLDRVVPDVRPRALLLANLFRDQLDRYGELETIADRWAAVVAGTPDTRLVLNADDPLVADLGRERADVLYVGVEDDGVALEGMAHASDSKHCRRCGAPYAYDAIYLGHMGRYHCPDCGARRPQPQVAAVKVHLDGTRGSQLTLRTPQGDADVRLPLPGLYNVYNALAAAGLALTLGAPLRDVVDGLQAVEAAFGRAEVVRVGERELTLLLVKNPAGANEVLRTLTLDEGEQDILAILNDNIADGRDVSWIWDADVEVLAPHVRRVTCSGTRAAELALRFKYAGVPSERISVQPALDRALDAAVADGEGRLVALPTYTAMLELRALLHRRGITRESFA
jgi:lipid II isoglutaminyl synthase (glutamine-hydrolysing)